MKKLIVLLLCVLSITASAQLCVLNTGNVSIQSHAENIPAMLYLGVGSTSFPNNTTSLGIYSHICNDNNKNTFIGVIGESTDSHAPFATTQAVGVWGVAGNASNGNNCGIYGSLTGNRNGAGVYGTTSGHTSVSGKYAGYFRGDTYVYGTLTATSVVSTSDARLKTNIESLNKNGSSLDNILNLNAISYNYIPSENKVELFANEDVTDKDLDERINNRRHYGLLAQELQEIYPDLVYEGQDGYLGVNYVELVPVLICAIQQLQEEINELKGADNAKKTLTLDNETTSVDNTSAINGNILYQNTPNPTKNQTTIRFSIADNTRDASICIMDMQGKMLKNAPISSGMSSITVDGNELGKGMFLYSLIVNGQEVDTKKMIIQNH